MEGEKPLPGAVPEAWVVNEIAEKYLRKEENEEDDDDDDEKPPRKRTRPKPYDVFDYYKERGPISRIAKHRLFENTTMLIIMVNAFWIGYDTNSNNALNGDISNAKLVFQFMENFFCFYFTLAVCIRFLAFKFRWNLLQHPCWTSNWFKFDLFLVTFMVIETWVVPLMPKAEEGGGESGMGQLSILRLLRLLRLTRMARLMRAVPELLTLVKGMAAAGRSVFCTLVLMLGFIYIFGIIFTTQLGKSTDPTIYNAYGDLRLAMFTLFISGTLCDNIIDIMGNLLASEDAGLPYVGLMFLFLLLSSFTVLNMLIGVLCEVVTETGEIEAENAMVQQIQEEITAVFETIDKNGDGTVSKDEFEQMKNNDIVIDALDRVGVRPKHFFALSDVLFEPAEATDDTDAPPIGGAFMEVPEEGRKMDITGKRTKQTSSGAESVELDFEDFLKTVVSQRPDKVASVMDAALLRQMFRTMVNRLDKEVEQFLGVISSVDGEPSSPITVDSLNDDSLEGTLSHVQMLIDQYDSERAKRK
jgi:hypothetical protein